MRRRISALPVSENDWDKLNAGVGPDHRGERDYLTHTLVRKQAIFLKPATMVASLHLGINFHARFGGCRTRRALNPAPFSTPMSEDYHALRIDNSESGCVARNTSRREEVIGRPLLGSDTKEGLDKLCLPYRVSSAQPFNLSLTHHVHRLDLLQRPLGGVERTASTSIARHLCLTARWSCSITLLRYFTRRNLQSGGKTFSFIEAANASG